MKISEKKILFIRNQIQDFDFKLDLNSEFGSSQAQYREKIRDLLGSKYSSHFNRVQLAALSDLNVIPLASLGFFSISHCQSVGGFSYSSFAHGCDAEQIVRISNPVIMRISSDSERSAAPDIKFLWVAKEAAFKAHSHLHKNLVLTDLQCEGWRSHSETGVHSFRMTSEKTLETKFNQGFLFSEVDVLIAVYFR